MSADGADIGPPKFRFGEIVRITGNVGETYWLANRAYPSDMFLGQEVAVREAFPARDHKGWRIGVAVPDPAVERGPELEGLAFPEDLLETTGLVEAWELGKYLGLVPLARLADTPPFRDWLRVDLLTNVLHPGESESDEDGDDSAENAAEWALVDSSLEPIRKGATASVRALLDPEYDGAWVEQLDDRPGYTSLMDFLEPPGDIVDAYERLTASPERGWVHDENDHGRPLSIWLEPLRGPSKTAAFLAPGIKKAEVECTCHSSPRSHSRRAPLYPELESYLEAGADAEWQQAARSIGLEGEADEEEYEEAIFRLRQVLVLVGADDIRYVDALLTGARPWALDALASVAEESTRRGFTPAAVSPDVIAIVALLATMSDTDELREITPFREELERAVARVAKRRHGL
jgi:hypothetical protein